MLNLDDKQIQSHFDSLAKNYDAIKRKNPFYYKKIKQILRSKIPSGLTILDFGCATGEIINYLSPSYGLGIDLSSRMIEIAKKKYQNNSNLKFKTNLQNNKDIFDYIILIDVIEHLSNPGRILISLLSHCSPETKLILTYVEPKWEPILSILEKYNLKMPEGPHRRIKLFELSELINSYGYVIIELKKYGFFNFLPFIKPLTVITFKKKPYN